MSHETLSDPCTVLKLSKPGSYDGNRMEPNCKMIFEDIHLEKITAQPPQSEEVHFLMKNGVTNNYIDAHALYPEIRIARCNGVAAYVGNNIADAVFEQCRIVRLTGSNNGLMPGALTFNSCKFEAEVSGEVSWFFMLGTTLGTSFVNCVLDAPQVDGAVRPDLTDLSGFIKINKEVHYNHINTRLGNEILTYYKDRGVTLSQKFVALIKSHHELEPIRVG